MRKVLVTGGAGIIGSHLVAAPVRRGVQVRVLDDLTTGKIANLDSSAAYVEFFERSVLDESLVARARQGVEVLCHEAALASVPVSVEKSKATRAACATGTLTVPDQTRRVGEAGRRQCEGHV